MKGHTIQITQRRAYACVFELQLVIRGSDSFQLMSGVRAAERPAIKLIAEGVTSAVRRHMSAATAVLAGACCAHVQATHQEV